MPSAEDILALVTKQVNNIIESWHLDAQTSPDTRLVDELGFSSMEFIDLLASIEMELTRKLPYQSLMVDEMGNYRQELSIGELSAFIFSHLEVTRSPL